MQPPQGGPPTPPSRGMAIGALVVGLIAFFGGFFPFVGFLGVIAVVLALKAPRREGGSRDGMATVGAGMGGLAVIGALLWAAFFTLAAVASCPHVYAFDGERYRLDGDMVSGALYRGGERGDLDRFEHLREVDGRYRVRVQNDLEEVDHINALNVVVVDHAPDAEVLPTEDGGLRAVRNAAAPTLVRDIAGRDRTADLAALDGRTVGYRRGASHTQTWTATFPRPTSKESAALVLRGSNTDFAEQAFVHYMTRFGTGTRGVMAWAMGDPCECNQEYLGKEVDKLGLPLLVEAKSNGRWVQVARVAPIGPAVLRSSVVPLDLPASDAKDVELRITATRRFWSLDQLQLGAATAGVKRRVLSPSRATMNGRDVLDDVRERDARRVVLQPTERLDVEFVAPAKTPGMRRTTLASLHGYYDVAIGGAPGMQPAAVIAHQIGVMSLPAFAADFEPPVE